jgi:hypothetical protein
MAAAGARGRFGTRPPIPMATPPVDAEEDAPPKRDETMEIVMAK